MYYVFPVSGFFTTWYISGVCSFTSTEDSIVYSSVIYPSEHLHLLLHLQLMQRWGPPQGFGCAGLALCWCSSTSSLLTTTSEACFPSALKGLCSALALCLPWGLRILQWIRSSSSSLESLSFIYCLSPIGPYATFKQKQTHVLHALLYVYWVGISTCSSRSLCKGMHFKTQHGCQKPPVVPNHTYIIFLIIYIHIYISLVHVMSWA